MRKIEHQMINAIIGKTKDWKSGNTKVCTTTEGYTHLYLHNNHIATVSDNGIILYDGGWQSVTTKSRLNAILFAFFETVRVFQKDFQWYISGDTTVPFQNGYVVPVG